MSGSFDLTLFKGTTASKHKLLDGQGYLDQDKGSLTIKIDGQVSEFRPGGVGLEADKPATLLEGESYFASDTYRLYVGGKAGKFPFAVLGFPFYKLIEHPEIAGKIVFRYYVDSIAGNDDNSGKTWETAKATINGVMADLPLNLGGYECHIAVNPGSIFYNTLIEKDNGKVIVHWTGEHHNTSTNAYAVWVANGKSDFTNDPITFLNTGGAKSFVSAGNGLEVYLNSVNPAIAPTSVGHGYAERFVFKATGSFILGNYVKGDGSNLIIFAPKFDLDGTTWSAIETTGNIRFVDPALYGNGTGASSKLGNDWGGAITLACSGGSQVIGKYGGGYKYAVGFEPKVIDGVYAKDISQLLQTGTYTGSGLSFLCGAFLYEDDIASFGKTAIRMTASAKNYNIQYHSDYVNLVILDGGSKTIKDIKTGETINYLTSTALSSGTNFIFPSLPTSDPAIAGALWSDSGTVKVSAG